MSGRLEPDAEAISAFVGALFRYAGDGSFVSLRAFDQLDDRKPPVLILPVRINGAGYSEVIETAIRAERDLANRARPSVFCPPIATFSRSDSAAEAAIANGLAISVELDSGDTEAARAKLEGLLGPATVVVASGGVWAHPQTGELSPKLHLHWRLSEATTDPIDHAILKRARHLACLLVGADPTAKTIVHPLRWPGTWHRKSAPKMATIAAINEAAEVHLADALDALETAVEAAGISEFGTGGPKQSGEPHAPILLLESAIAAIPNDDAHWDFWTVIGLLLYRATAASEEGLRLYIDWSRKSAKHKDGACEARWAHFATSPPTRGGAGTIFMLASAAGWKRPCPDTAPLPASDPTEDGIALAFAERFRDRLRYCHDTGAWHQWDGNVWRRETTMLAYDWCRETCRESGRGTGNAKLKAILGKAATASAVERFARADRAFAVTASTWDQDPFLLGTPAGTVDLRTGKLRPARQEDFITKTTSVAPAERADCPLWLRFLDDATRGDTEFIRFLRQWCGYSLTGDIREHALLFIFGPGGNGKTVLLNTVSTIIGDYATVAAMDTFAASQSDRHPTDLAMLRGARLVSVSETEEGRAWAETRIKALTGGDPISARFMRMDFFTFRPQFKITVIGNHKPVLRNVDEAARRRFNLAPFVSKPTAPDKLLEEKLRSEHPAILRWMIDGCLDWQATGLVRPPIVAAATAEYFVEQDTIRRWIEDCCEVSERPPHLADTSASLFASWRNYALARSEEPGSARSFADRLQGLGFVPVKDTAGIRGRGFRGLRVRIDPEGYTDAA